MKRKIRTIIIDNVDVNLLHKQKRQLVKEIWDKPNSILWGIVNLTDIIDDEYYYKK